MRRELYDESCVYLAMQHGNRWLSHCGCPLSLDVQGRSSPSATDHSHTPHCVSYRERVTVVFPPLMPFRPSILPSSQEQVKLGSPVSVNHSYRLRTLDERESASSILGVTAAGTQGQPAWRAIARLQQQSSTTRTLATSCIADVFATALAPSSSHSLTPSLLDRRCIVTAL